MTIYISEGQMRVLTLLLTGIHPVEMGKILGIANRTVKQRLASIYNMAGIDRTKFSPHIRLIWLLHTGQLDILLEP